MGIMETTLIVVTEHGDRFPQKLLDKPDCLLTMHWHASDHDKAVTRYLGADGFQYELDWKAGWFVVGRCPAV